MIVSSLIFISVTNMFNLTYAIESSWSEKHLSLYLTYGRGYKVDFFERYPGGLFEEVFFSRVGLFEY